MNVFCLLWNWAKYVGWLRKVGFSDTLGCYNPTFPDMESDMIQLKWEKNLTEVQ